MKRNLIGLFVMAAVTCLIVAPAMSDEPPKKPDAHHGHDHGSHAGHDHGDHAGHGHGEHAGGGADPMAAWMALATPGEHHKHLLPMIGHFKHTVKWRFAEEAPWTVSEGTTDRKWIMGERYMHETVHGSMGDMPFEGLALFGYDNGKKMYTCVWIDSMSTGMMYSTGQCDASGKVFTMTAETFDPMTQKVKQYKSVHTVINNQKHVFEMYDTDAKGKSFVSMSITYTRG